MIITLKNSLDETQKYVDFMGVSFSVWVIFNLLKVTHLLGELCWGPRRHRLC